MDQNHPIFGVLLLFAVVIFLFRSYLRTRPSHLLPIAGKVGLVIITLSEVLLYLQAHWVTIYFTPLVWTGYILLMDSLVFTIRGASLLQTRPRKFLTLAFWSVPFWLIFEAYNLRLKNWAYVGLPHSWLLSDLGYVWSFATIWPAIFETADFLSVAGLFQKKAPRRRPTHQTTMAFYIVIGAVCLILPVAIPPRLGAYLFGLVWIGFVLLLDPLNYLLRGRSLLREWESGDVQWLYSFLASGLICGVLWEFWNYWAHARWVYVFPILQNWKIFAMPAPGFFGFPPFALECFVMVEFLATIHRRFLSPSKKSTAVEADGNSRRRGNANS
ncbi:MAG: hypothetical protein ACRD3T_08415 [Terriglobia bacterium]